MIFCNHIWGKISDQILPAPVDSMTKMRGEDGSIPVWFFQKTHILIMVCNKCGKVYKSVEMGP